MSKKKSKSRPADTASTSRRADAADQHVADREASAKWWREAIESIVIAIILAFLFRTFEAEAFVIPTGSMAPTLQGRHKDVECPQCAHRYRAGASLDRERTGGPVIATTCPMCGYSMMLAHSDTDHASFTGDRILVNKFAYQFGEPQRWDVIVFKYPGNAKQNYIKRLIGLPGETVRIKHGDIYVKSEDDTQFRIARKPPFKLKRMLQLVHDVRHTPPELVEAGWPARWQPTDHDGNADPGWKSEYSEADGRTFSLAEPTTSESWLRYRHIVPSFDDWLEIEDGRTPPKMQQRRGELITDFYPYNAFLHEIDRPEEFMVRRWGLHWVGDLAIESDVEVLTDSGELLLDLVEAGRHYQCRIDVSNGEAQLSIDGGAAAFVATEDGTESLHPVATTKVRGPGTYRLRFANVDDQLLLWVGRTLIEFDGPTTYLPPADARPAWTSSDLGDLAPAGIGSRGAGLELSRLRILRDIYYVATSDSNYPTDYDRAGARGFFDQFSPAEIRRVMTTPETWLTTDLFDSRRYVDFSLEEDQFFPLGDNSPQSRDGRMWGVDPHVHRSLLTGKAFLIYWPHPWSIGIPGTGIGLPIVPNVTRMGRIR